MKLTATWTNSEGTLVFAQPGISEVLVWNPERNEPVLRIAHEAGIFKWGRWTRVDPPVEYDVPES